MKFEDVGCNDSPRVRSQPSFTGLCLSSWPPNDLLWTLPRTSIARPACFTIACPRTSENPRHKLQAALLAAHNSTAPAPESRDNAQPGFSSLQLVLGEPRSWPHAGSGGVRIDPLRFLAECRTRRINQDRYSRKQIIRTIEQRSYDIRRRCDTIYLQNVSQAIIVSYRYDTTSLFLASLDVTFRSKNCHSGCTKARHFDVQNTNYSNNNNEWLINNILVNNIS